MNPYRVESPLQRSRETGLTSAFKSFRALRRRWWVLALIWGGTLGVAGAYAATRPLGYLSDATIEVGSDTPTSAADLVGEMTGRTTPPWENHFRTQEALLRRPGLLKAVLDALPPESAAEYLASKDPVRALSRQLTIEAVRTTFLIRIMLEHSNPDHGPAVVNKLVQLFIEDSNRRLKEMKSGALEVLNQETLPEIHKKVVEAERRVREFQESSGFGDVGGRYATLAESRRRISDRLLAVRMRRIELASRPEPRREDFSDAAAPAGSDPDSLLGGARALEALSARKLELEVELARQRTLLKDRHATIISLQKQLAAVEQFIATALEAAARTREAAYQAALRKARLESAAVEAEEGALAKEEARLDEDIAVARARQTDFHTLEVEAAASRDLYNSYLKRQVEVKAMSGAGVAGVRIVDLAKGPVHRPGNTQVILTVGVIVGFLLGFGAVLLIEQHDDRAATPREAEEALGLELLASIPALPKTAGRNGGPALPKDDPVTSPLESFRRLRSEVVSRLQGIQGSKIVAVVGAGAGEGKSTVAVNLARTLGLEGRRVLLFDADFRHPRIKDLFSVPKRPGLEEYLRSNVGLEFVVHPSGLPGVDVLGASHALDESPELPGRARFRQLWSEVRSFDYVIVDAGSVNVFSEVAGVASQADAAILVMDERGTELGEVISARRILENHQVRILGLVVNRSRAASVGSPAAGRSNGRKGRASAAPEPHKETVAAGSRRLP